MSDGGASVVAVRERRYGAFRPGWLWRICDSGLCSVGETVQHRGALADEEVGNVVAGQGVVEYLDVVVTDGLSVFHGAFCLSGWIGIQASPGAFRCTTGDTRALC